MKRKLPVHVIAGIALSVSLLAVPAVSFAQAANQQSQGVKWFLENEQQKAALEAQGFPQYAP